MNRATTPTSGGPEGGEPTVAGPGDHPAAPARSTRVPLTAATERWLPVAVWVLAMAHTLVWLDRGWFPHDLGSVAHPAQRVLLGESATAAPSSPTP